MSRKIIIAQFALLCFIHRNFTIIIFSLLFILTQSRKNTTLFQKNGLSLENRKDLWRQNRQQEQASFSPIRCLKFSQKIVLNCGALLWFGVGIFYDVGLISWPVCSQSAKFSRTVHFNSSCRRILRTVPSGSSYPWLPPSVPLTPQPCTSCATTCQFLQHPPLHSQRKQLVCWGFHLWLLLSHIFDIFDNFRQLLTTFTSVWQTLAA